MAGGIQIHFWGTRGSGPAPFSDRMAYGGNTSCVSVRFQEGIVVFDAGTGLGALGRFLEEERRDGRLEAGLPIWIFISHLHLDHIQGLPLFSCLFWKEARIGLYGGEREGGFRRWLSGLMGPPYWPVSVEKVPADISWHELKAGESVSLPGGARVRTLRTEHPGGGLLFRLEREGQSVVYGLDCELGSSGEPGGIRESYREFARDCGLLIFDAPYTREEYPAVRGYGHSFWQQGVELAKECGAARLWVCHHDWGRTDAGLMAIEGQLKAFAEAEGLPACFAREGMEIHLG